MKWPVTTRLACVLAGLWIGGCTAGPPPIVIYEDAQTSVSLMFDPESGSGHNHPASITSEQMATILRGIHAKGRDIVVGFGLLRNAHGAPAFLPREVVLLAPKLSQALQKASPKDLATFYIVSNDPDQGLVITSGGVFVRNQRLYVILANVRTTPYSVQYENNYTPNLRDQPLLPIARFKFTAEFVPPDVKIPYAKAYREDGYERYLDESKVLVLDLPRVFAQTGAPAAAPSLRP